MPEGRIITKALLNGSLKGVGKLHKTPVFPCGIFQLMKGINRDVNITNIVVKKDFRGKRHFKASYEIFNRLLQK